STEDNTTTETIADGTIGASEDNTSDKGKKPAASASVDNPVFEKPEGKVVKKKITLKKRAARITIVSDSEETEEEQPLSKRKKIESTQMDTEAKT
ncbi:hypothetical protein A2U01_0062608, partial [Trifolium medium]|nr:hypothetical protein [Trifolium medium]